MKVKGLPVSLRPAVATIASNATHVLYPASDVGFFVLEEVESGTTNTLDCSKAGKPIKFVFSRHEVVLLSDSMVLFWSLENGSPLESWNGPAQDVYNEYGDWKIVGPNIVFDPVAQSSKNTEIAPQQQLSYKNQPTWVGKYLHVGSQAFDIGPFNCISCIHHYIITGYENKITVIFNLKEVGTIELDEQVLAVTGVVVDDDLELYFTTPTKVAQITAEIDFENIEALEDPDDEERQVLICGYFPHENGADEDTGAEAGAGAGAGAANDQASNDLLALIRNPAPPKPPSTTSLPAAGRDDISLPIAINEQHASTEDLKALVGAKIRTLPHNHAKPKTPTDSDYVSREYFDSVVATLTYEIQTLQTRIQELESPSKPQPATQQATQQAPAGQPVGQPIGQPVGQSSRKVVPASVADAVKKTIEGNRCLSYLEQHMNELRTYLDSAPIETGQLMKLVLIDAYHHTKLSKNLIDNFGPPIVDAKYYNKIIGEENA